MRVWRVKSYVFVLALLCHKEVFSLFFFALINPNSKYDINRLVSDSVHMFPKILTLSYTGQQLYTLHKNGSHVFFFLHCWALQGPSDVIIFPLKKPTAKPNLGKGMSVSDITI